MKNITVPVNDETYLQTRAWVAMRGTSVSALIKKIREKHAFNSQPPPSPISAKLCTQVEVFVFCLARRGQRRFDSSFLRQSEDAAQEQSRRWSGERGTEIHATGCAYVLSDM
jgi:hypothetical protein